MTCVFVFKYFSLIIREQLIIDLPNLSFSFYTVKIVNCLFPTNWFMLY